jgi:hypothetical protein
MSSIKPEFESVKADFLKAVETAHSLATYQAPLSAHEKQLESVGAAAVSFFYISFILWPGY